MLAEAVKKARKGLGLSQEDLALEAGLDRTYVSQVERGTRNCTIIVLPRLAKALKATLTGCWSLRRDPGVSLNLVRCQAGHFEQAPRRKNRTNTNANGLAL